MSGFSNRQLKALTGKLDSAHIHTREVEGRTLHYIEGWYAIAEANRIFGLAGWDRETVHFERAFERVRADQTSCGYLARVRVRVRTQGGEVVREGTGWGQAMARLAGDAHERALKVAETDATKRALATFGNRFGLYLYDKARNGTTAATPSNRSKVNTFRLFDPQGGLCADHLSPEGFCSGLRQLTEAAKPDQVLELKRANEAMLTLLRKEFPQLKSGRGEHYADILCNLMIRKMSDSKRDGEIRQESETRNSDAKPGPQQASRPQEVLQTNAAQQSTLTGENQTSPTLNGEVAPINGINGHVTTSVISRYEPAGPDTGHANDRNATWQTHLKQAKKAQEANGSEDASDPVPLAPSKIAPGPRIDKSRLSLGSERRLRDKNHLRRVAQLPCIVCGRQPCHAHHVKFSQRRGMSMKVSDEFVVPLCALHHGDLHRATKERDWWERQNIAPLPIAARLWAERRADE